MDDRQAQQTTTIQPGDRVIHEDTPQFVYVVKRIEDGGEFGPIAVFADGKGFWRCSGLRKVAA